MQKKPKCCVPGECINVIAISLANTIAKDLTVEELGQLSTILSIVSSALGVIATTRILCEDDSTKEITLV